MTRSPLLGAAPRLVNGISKTLHELGDNYLDARRLWGSTSSKDPRYPPLRYVEALIGRDTVATVPLDTWHAFLAGGRIGDTLDDDHDSESQLATLAELGIDLDAVTEQLERDGVDAFRRSHDALLQALAARRRAPPDRGRTR